MAGNSVKPGWLARAVKRHMKKNPSPGRKAALKAWKTRRKKAAAKAAGDIDTSIIRVRRAVIQDAIVEGKRLA